MAMWRGAGGFGMHSTPGVGGLPRMAIFGGLPLLPVIAGVVVIGRLWNMRGVQGSNALSILEECRAHGEIDIEELDERRRKLGR